MKVAMWHIYAFLAFILWGLWGFLPKIATFHLNEKSIIVWEGLGFLILTVFLIFSPGFKLDTNPKGVALSAFIGIIALLAELFFIFALKQGKTTIVVALTSLYPLLTIILAFIFLRETITLKQLVGILMAFTAMYLLV